MERILWAACGLAGASAVAAGAFGAHALKARLPADLLTIYQTGAHYHLIHAVALGLCAALQARSTAGAGAAFAGVCFTAGIILFSGTLYVLSLTGARWLGAITPLGGVAFIAGWLSFAWIAIGARAPAP